MTYLQGGKNILWEMGRCVFVLVTLGQAQSGVVFVTCLAWPCSAYPEQEREFLRRTDLSGWVGWGWEWGGLLPARSGSVKAAAMPVPARTMKGQSAGVPVMAGLLLSVPATPYPCHGNHRGRGPSKTPPRKKTGRKSLIVKFQFQKS